VGVKGALQGGNLGSEKDKKLHEGLRVYMGQLGQATVRIFWCKTRKNALEQNLHFYASEDTQHELK
jgi:hypothetical protein